MPEVSTERGPMLQAAEQERLAVLLRLWREDKKQPVDATPQKLVSTRSG